MDMPGDEGPEDADLDMNMGADDKDDDEDEVLEGVHMVDEEEVVSETLRRVTKRIKNMSKRNRMGRDSYRPDYGMNQERRVKTTI